MIILPKDYINLYYLKYYFDLDIEFLNSSIIYNGYLNPLTING